MLGLAQLSDFLLLLLIGSFVLGIPETLFNSLAVLCFELDIFKGNVVFLVVIVTLVFVDTIWREIRFVVYHLTRINNNYLIGANI